MKIKFLSFLLTFIILVFSFCPLAFASDNDNLIDVNMSRWDIVDTGLVSSVEFVGGPENRNRVYFLKQTSNDANVSYITSITGDIISDKDYQFSCDLLTYEMHNVACIMYLLINYGDETEWIELYDGGMSNTNPNYENIKFNIKPKIENRSYTCSLVIAFTKSEGGTVISGANCTIKNLSLIELESKEGNILKRIYNFIINLPSTFQNFFIDLKNGISSFFTDLKDNLSGWFDNLKTSVGGFFTDLKNKLSTLFDNLKNSIGNFFGNLSDNLSGFFNKLKNWLLWFNAEGASSYTNPFNQVDDDIEDDLESNIVKLANYINDNTQSVSDSLASVGSVFLVFDAFVVGIPLVLSLVIFAFFIHILKRLFGF